MTKQVEVLDSLMGCGKTTGIINWMKDNPENKYIYISPRLSEVEERIPVQCPELNFKTPDSNSGKKSDSMLELLRSGENIAATHALYQQLTEEHTDAVAFNNYILIIDEEVDFITSYNKYTPNDIATLKQEGFIDVDYNDGGRIIWKWDEMKDNTAYTQLRTVCKLGMLYLTKSGKLKDKDDPDSHLSNELLVTHIPPKLVDVSERVIVLTYKYKGSTMDKFFSLRGYSSKEFDEITLMKSEQEVKRDLVSLINFVETPSTRKVKRYNLTKYWYEKTATKSELDLVAKAIISVARKCNVKADDLLYTMPKDVVIKSPSSRRKTGYLKINRYSPEECFLYSSCRATNDYKHKNTIVHAYNRYPNIAVDRYLKDYEQQVDQDQFALAEMLQWIFRSCIRDGRVINLCILNTRMYNLFINWLREG